MCSSWPHGFDNLTSTSTTSTTMSSKLPTNPKTTPQTTLYHRRNSSLTPLILTNLPTLTTSRSTTPPTKPHPTPNTPSPIDLDRWQNMLKLQRQYHCYNSARLEAAVQALENGLPIEMVPIPSRLCLDLLDQDLEAKVLIMSTLH